MRSSSNWARNPVTLSDPGGFIHDPDGIDEEKLAWVMTPWRRAGAAWPTRSGSRATFTPADPSSDHNGLWEVPADCAFPSATHNEINGKDAANLISNGVSVVSEGANMPTLPEGIDQL